MRLGPPEFERLRQKAKYAGLNDWQIECEFHELRDVSTEALLETLRSRGHVVEVHVFDPGPSIGLEG